MKEDGLGRGTLKAARNNPACIKRCKVTRNLIFARSGVDAAVPVQAQLFEDIEFSAWVKLAVGSSEAGHAEACKEGNVLN